MIPYIKSTNHSYIPPYYFIINITIFNICQLILEATLYVKISLIITHRNKVARIFIFVDVLHCFPF